MKKIFVCSPYRGDVERNVKYAEKVCNVVASNGYAPFAPHLFYTRFLNDDNQVQREVGIKAGKAWMEQADELWICSSEITEGMKEEIEHALDIGLSIRSVYGTATLDYMDLEKPTDQSYTF